MLRFPKSHKNCRTIKLMQNYRSLPAIIGAANSLIRHNRDRFPVEGVPIRRDADPANPSLVVFDGEKTEKESLAWFVKALLHLHKAGRGWEEFARDKVRAPLRKRSSEPVSRIGCGPVSLSTRDAK